MNDTATRTRIGRNNDFATRQIIYRTPLGIEVDELDHFEVVRKRVFYDDVLLVTLHRQQTWGFLVLTALVVLLFGGLAVVAKDVAPLAMTLGAVAAVALVFGTIRLLYQVEVVSVFGRRSKASIRFGFRRARAAQMFNEICANVAAAQRRLAREIAANEPPEETVAVEELPPMPGDAQSDSAAVE
ncbi:MAG TPA: hypothetical protein VI670_08170 [Thermoanaerobaculia bacterium]|jgi:hypothetical protein